MDLQTARALAAAAKNKSNSRVSQETVMSTVTEFLNSDNDTLNVENVYRVSNPTKPLSQILASFRKAIIESGVDELVYPIKDAEHVILVKLTD